MQYWSIYRWAHYILALDDRDQALPLFCQAFFALYCARVNGQFFGHAFLQKQRGGDAYVTPLVLLAAAGTLMSDHSSFLCVSISLCMYVCMYALVWMNVGSSRNR